MQQSASSAIALLCGGPITLETYWRTSARIASAVFAFKLYRAEYLLISSGISGHLNQHERPEAHEYLEAIRAQYPELPTERLLVEDLSRDTVGNIYFSIAILRLLLASPGQVYWVSNAFHINRIQAIVGAFDIKSSLDHRFVSVPDCGPCELLEDIYRDEAKSLQRFKQDYDQTGSPEGLLFLKHDFYRVDRLNTRIR